MTDKTYGPVAAHHRDQRAADPGGDGTGSAAAVPNVCRTCWLERTQPQPRDRDRIHVGAGDGARGSGGSAARAALTPLNTVLAGILMISTVMALGGVANAVIDRIKSGAWQTIVIPMK